YVFYYYLYIYSSIIKILITIKILSNKVMVSTAFKLENFAHRIPLTTPYISFVGKIYSKPNQIDNDCVMGVNVNEYNSFNFTNKGRIDFKIQVVYDVKPDSRFKKLTPKFEIGKTIFIAG